MSKNKNSKKQGAEAKQEKKVQKKVPSTHSTSGALLKLKRGAFPSNRSGRIAYAEYQIELWTLKLAKAKTIPSQKEKMQGRLAKLMAKAAELEEKISEIK